MSGEHELPPGWRVEPSPLVHRAWRVFGPMGLEDVARAPTRISAVSSAWEHFGITRERYLALLDAERRCAELERVKAPDA